MDYGAPDGHVRNREIRARPPRRRCNAGPGFADDHGNGTPVVGNFFNRVTEKRRFAASVPLPMAIRTTP